ncbi:MAG: GNAT family N-acetyltransferase [Streptosporangiales bacterium]|nr:GNAT family N-acetyltransferase [Streptosporangiales bacterium]
MGILSCAAPAAGEAVRPRDRGRSSLPSGRRRPDACGMNPRDPPPDAALRDGRVVHIRPVTRDDAPALHALHRHASEQSIYLRFSSRDRDAADRYVDHICADADTEHRALIAELDGQAVALADSHHTPGTDDTEIAVLVHDDYQQLGIGTLLVAHLAARARQTGSRRLVAEVLPGNTRGLHLLTRSRFHAELPVTGATTMVLDITRDLPDPFAADEGERVDRDGW